MYALISVYLTNTKQQADCAFVSPTVPKFKRVQIFRYHKNNTSRYPFYSENFYLVCCKGVQPHLFWWLSELRYKLNNGIDTQCCWADGNQSVRACNILQLLVGVGERFGGHHVLHVLHVLEVSLRGNKNQNIRLEPIKIHSKAPLIQRPKIQMKRVVKWISVY